MTTTMLCLVRYVSSWSRSRLGRCFVILHDSHQAFLNARFSDDDVIECWMLELLGLLISPVVPWIAISRLILRRSAALLRPFAGVFRIKSFDSEFLVVVTARVRTDSTRAESLLR